MTVAKPQLSRFLNTIQRVSRFSSAVEQRFCKPKVGSSILSTGTNVCSGFLNKCSPAFRGLWSKHAYRATLGYIRQGLSIDVPGETVIEQSAPSDDQKDVTDNTNRGTISP